MLHQTFSQDFKRACVQKVLTRGSKNVRQISQEVGVSLSSLYYWVQQHSNGGEVKISKRRHDRSAEEKFRAVAEFVRLPLEEQGEYLRREGLVSPQIQEWKKTIEEALTPQRRNRRESLEDKNKIKELERELRRKDKALAETSALLVLKKKADLIWGTEESE